MNLQNMLIVIHDIPIYLYIHNIINVEEYHQLCKLDWLGLFNYFKEHNRIKLEICDTKEICDITLNSRSMYGRLSIIDNNTCKSIW